jgi:hypothetical protein
MLRNFSDLLGRNHSLRVIVVGQDWRLDLQTRSAEKLTSRPPFPVMDGGQIHTSLDFWKVSCRRKPILAENRERKQNSMTGSYRRDADYDRICVLT